MRIRQNIFISIMIHTMVITSVFIVGSSTRDTADRVPESYMMVSLFKEMTGIISITSQRTKKDKISPPPFPPPQGGRVKEGVYMDKIASSEPTLANPSNTDVIPGSSIASTAISVSHITGQIPSEEFIAKSQFGNKIVDNTEGGSGKRDISSLYALIRVAIEKAKTYPFLARKKRIEGTVITGFTINNKGYPQDIKVARSSGSEILDSAAVKIVMKAAPFPEVTGEIIVPITFKLTEAISSN